MSQKTYSVTPRRESCYTPNCIRLQFQNLATPCPTLHHVTGPELEIYVTDVKG